MKWIIATVGSPKLAFAKLGTGEYLGRIGRKRDIRMASVKAGTPSTEAHGLLAAAAGSDFCIVLDETGDPASSIEIARRIEGMETRGFRRAAVLIGGANGHGPGVLESADWVLALGKITLQHELALIVVLEQIYRAYEIIGGSPYHRGTTGGPS